MNETAYDCQVRGCRTHESIDKRNQAKKMGVVSVVNKNKGLYSEVLIDACYIYLNMIPASELHKTFKAIYSDKWCRQK